MGSVDLGETHGKGTMNGFSSLQTVVSQSELAGATGKRRFATSSSTGPAIPVENGQL